MTDKIIINTISKIHFTLISFFIFVIFTLSVGFLVLQEGVSFQKLDLAKIKIEQLYIKWDEKLSISAQKITIKPKKGNTKKLDFQALNDTLGTFAFFMEWVEKITFGNIQYGDSTLTIDYKEKEGGTLTAASESFDLHATFALYDDTLALTIKELNYRHAKLFGKIHCKQTLYDLHADLSLQMNDTDMFALHIDTDDEKLHYVLHAKEPIQELKKFLTLIDFPKEVQYWAYEAIELERFELSEFQGFVSFDDPAAFYKQLHAKGYAHLLNYTYDADLEPIRTLYTELEFQNGILYIRPHESRSYGFDLNESRLQIDFTQPQEILTLRLAFEGSLSQDVLNILNNYRVSIPFLQNKGTTDVDLTLIVNLHTIDIQAQGKFTTRDANFNFFEVPLEVASAEVLLHNGNVSVTAKNADYKNIATADVDAKIDTANNKGEVALDFTKIAFAQDDVFLKKNQPFKARYIFDKDNDTLVLSPSFWSVKGIDVEVAKNTLPVNFNTLEGVLPKTNIQIPGKGSLEIKGKGSLKSRELHLDINILNFVHDKIRLAQKYTPLELHYTADKAELTAKRDTLLEYDKQKFRLSKTKLLLQDEKATLEELTLAWGKHLNLRLKANYDLAKNRGEITLKNSLIKNQDATPLFTSLEPLEIEVEKRQGVITSELKKLSIAATYDTDAWHVDFLQLDKLLPYAPVLNDYNITNGTLKISKHHAKEKIDFTLETRPTFAILHAKEKHIDNYRMEGSYTPSDESLRLNINKNVFVLLKDQLAISANDIGIDLFELLRFLENFPQKKGSTSLPVLFEGENTYLYLNKERRILADSFHLYHNQNTIEANLACDKGVARLSYDAQKQFLLHGENFSDRFMEQLFAYSKFQDANLSFTLNGDIEDFKGVLYIKDSTIKDYKILNNVLAFVNTIPSLVTFSLPGYSTQGMYVTNGYIKFHAKELLFDISDILLESKEISILGKGVIDYKKDNVDLELNLKTDLGSSASQIPILGYILFDGKSVATTLSVQGTLKDPQVSSLLAKEIMVAPLNIIKRTFLLPFRLFSDEEEE